MIIQKLKDTAYFEATYKGSKHLGYSFYEAISRAISAIKPNVGTRRMHHCKKAKEMIEQEWTGTEWLCLHN